MYLLAVGSLQNPDAVDVARGISERWPVLTSLDGFFGHRYGNKDGAWCICNSLFLGSTTSKHIYTVYPVILCACFIYNEQQIF